MQDGEACHKANSVKNIIDVKNMLLMLTCNNMCKELNNKNYF